MFYQVKGVIPGIDKKIWTWPRDNPRMLRYFDAASPSDVNAAVDALPFIRGSCVQAGGSMGVWPLRLAQFFTTVYTFEPDPDSFHCLRENTRDVQNIRAHHAALGEQQGLVGVTHPELDNYGATQVTADGQIEMKRIDDLQLEDCGLIYLDVEGFESRVIRGALQTIERCKPIIGVEVKLDKEVVPLLKSMGYRVHATIFLDVMLRAD